MIFEVPSNPSHCTIEIPMNFYEIPVEMSDMEPHREHEEHKLCEQVTKCNAYVRKIETKWGENKNKNEKNPTNPLCISNASVSRLYGNDTSTHPFSSPLSFPSFHYSPSTLSDISIVSEAPTGAL